MKFVPLSLTFNIRQFYLHRAVVLEDLAAKIGALNLQ